MAMTDKSDSLFSVSSQKESRCYFPVRYQLVVLLFFGTCASYMIRTNMSLAIVAMVNKTAIRAMEHDCSIPTDPWCVNGSVPESFTETSCPVPERDTLNGTKDDDQEKEGSFVWKSSMQGVIVGSFFYGYASTQIIGGRMGDRMGPKWLIGGGILAGAILTLLVPIVSELGDWYLVALRVVTGMTQGCLYPGLAALFNRWVPSCEKGRFYTLCNAGAAIGMVITMPMVGFLCEQSAFADGWPAVFYTIGGVGVIWSLLWMFLAQNDPSTHTGISLQERKYINDNLPVVRSQDNTSFPWKSVFTSVPVWAHIFAWVTTNWIFYIRMTEFPNYLDQVLHFPIQQNGIINALVNFLPIIFSVTGGFVGDYVIANGKMRKITVRKTFECLSLLGSSTCLTLVVLAGCHHPAAISLLVLCGGFQGLANIGDGLLAMDMAPTLSGTLFGIGNTFCAVIGFICPTIVGFFLSIQGDSLMEQWHYVFYFTYALCIVGAVVTVLFWSADVQPWDPSAALKHDFECQDPKVNDDVKLIWNEQRHRY